MNSNIESNKDKVEKYVDKYLKRYDGRELLKEHTLDEYGVWEVTGENPNPILGGDQNDPLLGTFTGYLRDAIAWGVMQPDFWVWGSGGSGGSFIKISKGDQRTTSIEVEYYTASWHCPNCSEYTKDYNEGVDNQGDSFEVVCGNCKYSYKVKDRR